MDKRGYPHHGRADGHGREHARRHPPTHSVSRPAVMPVSAAVDTSRGRSAPVPASPACAPRRSASVQVIPYKPCRLPGGRADTPDEVKEYVSLLYEGIVDSENVPEVTRTCKRKRDIETVTESPPPPPPPPLPLLLPSPPQLPPTPPAENAHVDKKTKTKKKGKDKTAVDEYAGTVLQLSLLPLAPVSAEIIKKPDEYAQLHFAFASCRGSGKEWKRFRINQNQSLLSLGRCPFDEKQHPHCLALVHSFYTTAFSWKDCREEIDKKLGTRKRQQKEKIDRGCLAGQRLALASGNVKGPYRPFLFPESVVLAHEALVLSKIVTWQERVFLYEHRTNCDVQVDRLNLVRSVPSKLPAGQVSQVNDRRRPRPRPRHDRHDRKIEAFAYDDDNDDDEDDDDDDNVKEEAEREKQDAHQDAKPQLSMAAPAASACLLESLEDMLLMYAHNCAALHRTLSLQKREPHPSYICYRCDGKGHFSADCPILYGRASSHGQESIGRGRKRQLPTGIPRDTLRLATEEEIATRTTYIIGDRLFISKIAIE